MRSVSSESVAGLWLEFLDAESNTVARQIVDDWRRRIPRRGETLRWSGPDGRALEGLVVARQDDLQHAASGEPILWVRLLVRIGGNRRLHRREFSLN